MSIAYIGHKLETERTGKAKISTEVAHVTRDLDTTFKVKGRLVGGGGILWRPPTQLVLLTFNIAQMSMFAGWISVAALTLSVGISLRHSNNL